MTEQSGHNLDPTGSAAVQEALSKKEELLSQHDPVLSEGVPHRVNIRGAYRRKIDIKTIDSPNHCYKQAPTATDNTCLLKYTQHHHLLQTRSQMHIIWSISEGDEWENCC